MPETLEDWAGHIIGNALADVQSLDDVKRIDEKVRSTAISAVPQYLKTWEEVLERKRKYLEEKAKTQ
ncbi:hypothetical protein ES705_48024 [subsurface metagenome]